MADARSLEQAKTQIGEQFLGRGGVHAIGLSHEPDAIKIYLNREADEKSALLDELRTAAQPYEVIVIREDQAKVQ